MYDKSKRFNPSHHRFLPEANRISNGVNPSPNAIQILILPSLSVTLQNPNVIPILISSPIAWTPENLNEIEIWISTRTLNVTQIFSSPTVISSPKQTSNEIEPFSFGVGRPSATTRLMTMNGCDVACRPRCRFRHWRFAICCRRSRLTRTPWPWKQFFVFVSTKVRLLRVVFVFVHPILFVYFDY